MIIPSMGALGWGVSKGAAMKTSRLTVLMDPDDKRRIEDAARRHGLSTGELVRRASRAYDPDSDDEALGAAIDEWRREVEAMAAHLRDGLAHVRARLAEVEAIRAAGARDGAR